jgi:sigma-B regulation protein RsbU (phosphoserine phosphatase)
MAAKFQRDDQAVLKGKAIEVVEMNQPPGKPVAYVQVVKTPLRGAYGEIIGLQGIFWDITQQKLAEERVRQAQEDVRASETLYHSLVDVMPQSIFRKDMEGRYTFANQEFCRTLRRDLEQVLGKTIHDFLPKPLADQRVQDDLRVMESRLPFSQIEQSRFEGRDDQFIQVLKIPILDAGGNVTGLQGMFWDITELKTAEQRIRRANEELAASQEKLRRRNGEMENDLKMAGEIQAAMLPSHLPTFPKGVSSAESAFHFSHRYRPTKAVGGDFYHVMALSDTEAAVFLCDVAGHGVRSALVTAMIRALLEELRPFAGDPGQFLTKLNKDLGAILKNPDEPILTTAFYLVADSATDTLRFANAGHPKPILVRRKLGTVELLVNSNKKNQAALGVFEKITYQTSQVPFGGGDMVVLFTDGLYEVHNESGLYAQEMLTAVVQRHSQLSATKLFDKVLAEIRQFAGTHEFDDDVCLVGVERTEK